MRNKRDKEVLRVYRNFYTDDLEYFLWLCKINKLSWTDMFTEILRVYPQANTEK